MAAVVTDRHYRQLLATSLADRQREIQDLVFNSNPILALIEDNGKRKPYYGPEIRVPLMIDRLDAQWFTGYDKLNNEPKELVNDAVFTPKNVAVGFSLTGTELLANEGRAKIIDLMDTYLENAENSMRDEMEIALHGDGTGTGGRSIIGFGGALPITPTAGVYGGIDRANHPIWRTATYNVEDGDIDGFTTWDSTTARPIIERVVAMHSKGRRRADVLVADINSYQAISASLVAHQRITSTRLGRLGFDALEIATPAGPVAVICANGVGTTMPEDTIYGLDMEALTLYYHPSRNFVPLFPGDGAQPVNQDAIAQYLAWNGELVLSNPRYSWRLITAN